MRNKYLTISILLFLFSLFLSAFMVAVIYATPQKELSNDQALSYSVIAITIVSPAMLILAWRNVYHLYKMKGAISCWLTIIGAFITFYDILALIWGTSCTVELLHIMLK